MSQLSIKAQLNYLYEDRNGVALVFGAVGEDGVNDAWAPAAGPEAAFRLEMTTSLDVVQNAGLTAGQRYTLTFDLDDRHATVGDGAIVAPEETTTHTVVGDDGELTEVSAAEARERGYETSVSGASGLAVGPQQHAPVLSLPEEQAPAQAPEATETPDAEDWTGAEDGFASHGEVHDASEERPADAPIVSDEAHIGTETEHDEHRAAE